MADAMHPAASGHLPAFIVHPGGTDYLMTGSAVFLVFLVFVLGALYFSLHALPERFAHGTSKLQFEVVAVLALLALFTHDYRFWVAALLLGLVPIPDFWTPLSNMAASLARLAARSPLLPDVPAQTPPASSDDPLPPVTGGVSMASVDTETLPARKGEP